jgi:cyclic nucleotide gated channel
VVQNLENHGDQNLLERICDSLEPKYYNEGIYVLRKGEPLMMLFITQGSLRCFETNNGENSMGTDSGGPQDIGKGKLYGEELLWWGLNNRSSSHQKSAPPGSTKIVKTTSKVEAFALTANDLKNLVPMHTRAAEATKIFVNRVFGSYRKENKNENSPKFH